MLNPPDSAFVERITRLLGEQPSIHPTAFVAANATVIGAVSLEEEASIWFHTTVRGDINSISIGPRSNIQDGSVIHVADAHATQIGELVTVGHMAIVHACTVHDEVLVGMRAVVMDGTEIGARSIIGAGALVTSGTKVPPGSLVLGSPAKVVRALSQDEQKSIRVWAERYVALSRIYRDGAAGQSENF